MAEWDWGGSLEETLADRPRSEYPDSFTGKGRNALGDRARDSGREPEYVGSGGHSFAAHHARDNPAPPALRDRGGHARVASGLQPTAPGGRVGGWNAGPGGGGGGGAGGGGGGGSARPSQAAAPPKHVIAAPVAD